MFGDYRFRAAYAMIDAVAKPVLAVDGVTAFMLEEAPDSDPDNPGGPQFTIYTDDAGPALQAQSTGTIPKTVKSRFDEIKLVIVELPLVEYAHTGADTPMQPGSSLGGTKSGTLGARVTSPGPDHVVTAGHVLGAEGTDVLQPGAAYPNPRTVGTVVENPFRRAGADVALARIDTRFPVSPVPFEAPQPGPATPAAGLFLGAFGGKVPLWLDIASCLAAVNAALPTNATITLTDKNIGDRVFASGSTSELIACKVIGVGPIPQTNGTTVNGFTCMPIRGGAWGDSGAVCVVKRGVSTRYLDDNSIRSQDDDTWQEWLPGVFPPLDTLTDGDGTGINVNGMPVAQGLGKTLLSRISSYLKSLTDLSVVVNASGFEIPCRVALVASPRLPDRCREVILRSDGEIQIPSTDDGPSAPGEPGKGAPSAPGEPSDGEVEILGKKTCCTFGKNPVVVISGDDEAGTSFSLSISGVTVKVEFSIKQRVLAAWFRRFGVCHTGVCDREIMSGTVFLRRSYRLVLSASGGNINLPGIGMLSTGADFKREPSTSITKSFRFPCANPDS